MPTLISGGWWLLASCAALCGGLLLSVPGTAATPVSAGLCSLAPPALTPSGLILSDLILPELALTHPARPTVTPSVLTPPVVDFAGTSTAAPVPACTTVFPVERVEDLLSTPLSIPQLEAAFGRAAALGGRPTRLRFTARGCTLLITPGDEAVQEAELVDYGALDWLLTRYGDPAAVGVSQGNLVLPMTGYTVLLYPDMGVVAMFASEPDTLTATLPANSLIFRPPYTLEDQVRRLNLRLVEVDIASLAGFPTK